MSKFHVTKKDYLKYTSSRNANAKPEPVYPDEDEMLADLRHERSPTWRKEVMLMLANDEKKTKTQTQPPAVNAPRQYTEKPGPVRRIDMLAEPKIRQDANDLSYPFRVRPSALIHTASDRLHNLAIPRRLHARTVTKLQEDESKSDLDQSACSLGKRGRYELSERLKHLARPRQPVCERREELRDNDAPMARFTYGETSAETRTNRMARLMELTKIPRHKLATVREKRPGAVAYSALVCRASPRVEELAGPRIRRQPRQNDFAFRIRPAALRYHPSSRIENLARAVKFCGSDACFPFRAQRETGIRGV